jgi:hypothetical protein
LWKFFTPGLFHIKVKNITSLIKDTSSRKIGKFIFTLYSKISSTTKLLEFPNSNNIYSLLSNQGQISPEDEAWENPESINVPLIHSQKPSETQLHASDFPSTLAYVIPTADFRARVRSTPKRIQDRNPVFHTETRRAPNYVNLNAKVIPYSDNFRRKWSLIRTRDLRNPQSLIIPSKPNHPLLLNYKSFNH